MRIAVKADQRQREEWMAKQTSGSVEILWMEHEVPAADAYFDLCYDERNAAFSEVKNNPVFSSSMIHTLQKLPSNVSRINAWNGFIKNGIIEVVLRDDTAAKVLDELGWRYHNVPDVPGMIAPRTISMIINEAYFALGDEVSSKDEIDIAMKLGTNYPFGPFEWSRHIGLHNVYRLLRKLSETDIRYLPAPAMEQELKAIA